MRSWHVYALVVDLCISMLAGPMYALRRLSTTGLCELVCADSIDAAGGQRKGRRVVPCFVLPVAGCAGHAIAEFAEATEVEDAAA